MNQQPTYNWKTIELADGDGDLVPEGHDDTRVRYLREFRQTGSMYSVFLADEAVTPEQIDWCGFPERPMTPDDLVTLAEVAARAGVSRLTPRQWVRRDLGAPEPWKPGRFGDPHLYLWAEWETWLRATGRLA